MSTRYPGGFINRSAPVIVGPTNGEGGSAPGVWTLEQASYYTKQGTWPQRVKDRPLYSWGINTYGQLAQSDTIARSSPVQVGSQSNWYLFDCASGAVVSTKTNGTLWSWGYNAFGQLGQNNAGVSLSSPVQVGSLTTWLKVACAEYASYAIKTDGTLWSWGRNQYGQLGQNIADTISRSSPVQVGSQTNWSLVSANLNNMGAIKTDGTLWMCGKNDFGQIGDITYINRSSPVQIGTQTTWATVSLGNSFGFTLATKTNGTLWGWGYNGLGNLGIGVDGTIVTSPVQVGALTTWASVSAGGLAAIAIKTDGTIWGWGRNDSGQLGQNNIINKSSPVQIGSIAAWSKVSIKANTALAIKTDGALWGWGNGSAGTLGQNSSADMSSPVQVGSNKNWNNVSNYTQFSVATQAI